MSIEDKQEDSPTDRDPGRSAGDQPQEQIDALVGGEVARGPRSLRDLTKTPELGLRICNKNTNEKPD